MIRNGYYIASDACGRDKNGKFVCVCGKCRVMTNADRIRAMTDEELGHWLYLDASERENWSLFHWLKWLREEVKDDNSQV